MKIQNIFTFLWGLSSNILCRRIKTFLMFYILIYY